MGYIYNFLACRGSRLPLAKRLFYFSLFTLSFFTSPVLAQDAFYIYRNDGDFDGFFYDEVVRMGYSKIDFNGFQHDHYVVQEVETKDSLYRIPLACIDSIGFVQPAVKFAPHFRNIVKDGLIYHLENVSIKTGWMFVSNSVPDALVPKVGDVLACLDVDEALNLDLRNSLLRDLRDYDFPRSFAVKVTNVEPRAGGFYSVNFEPVSDLADVVTQLISVEMIGTDEVGNVRRRVAGFNPEGMLKSPLRAENEHVDFTLVDISGNIKREWEPKEGVNIDLAAEYEMKVKMKVTYNISWQRIYVKFERPLDIKVKPSLGLTCSKNFELIGIDGAGLPKFLNIKFPAALPLFQTAPVPEFFVRGGGSVNAKLSFPAMKFGYVETVIVDTDLPIFPFRYYVSKSSEDEGTQESPIDVGEGSLSFNGFLQTGLKFSANIQTNDWLEKIFSSYIGLDIFCGPRIDANFKLSTDQDYYSQWGKYGQHMVWRSGDLKFAACSVDLEAKAWVSSKWLGFDKERPFFDGQMVFGDSTFYAVPTFDSLRVNVDKKTEVVRATLYPKEEAVVLPCSVGVGAFRFDASTKEYDFSKPFAVEYDSRTFNFVNPFAVSTATFSGLPAGLYILAPMVKALGIEMPVAMPRDVIIPHHLTLAEHDVKLSGKEETKVIELTTTGDYAYVLDERGRAVTDGPLTSWLNCLAGSLKTSKVIVLEAQANDMSLFPRKFDLYVTAGVKEEQMNPDRTGSDTLHVTQYSSVSNGDVTFEIDVPATNGEKNQTRKMGTYNYPMNCTVTFENDTIAHIVGSDSFQAEGHSDYFSWDDGGGQLRGGADLTRTLDIRVNAGSPSTMEIVSGSFTIHAAATGYDIYNSKRTDYRASKDYSMTFGKTPSYTEDYIVYATGSSGDERVYAEGHWQSVGGSEVPKIQFSLKATKP